MSARRVINKTLEQSTRNAKMIQYLIFLLCVCLAFIIGFVLRGNADLLERVGIQLTSVDQTVNPGETVSGNTFNSVSARVAEMQGILDNESLDSYELSTTTDAVLGSFVSSTEDPYLRYYDQSRYATYLKETSNTYADIGVLFNEYQGTAYAVDVFSGSQAQADDVREGDFVVAIDGDRSQDWSLVETVKALTKNEGESVVITWRRPSSLEAEGGREFTTTLTCTTYVEPNIVSRIESDDVGYIKVSQLTQNSTALVQSAVTDLAGQGATSYVIDLRNNPGGYLTQAVNIASLFVKSGVAVNIQSKSTTSARSVSGKAITDAPVVVLVNENTSSAAEVLVAALQDNSRATVVGVQTLGKGSVQSIRELSFGGALRYTSAYYLTPNGREFNGAGISPDVIVDLNTESGNDNQFSLAVETARSLALAR